MKFLRRNIIEDVVHEPIEIDDGTFVTHLRGDFLDDFSCEYDATNKQVNIKFDGFAAKLSAEIPIGYSHFINGNLITIAAGLKDLRLLTFLLDHINEIDPRRELINQSSIIGRTPLQSAFEADSKIAFKDLLAKGANPFLRSKQGSSPYEVVNSAAKESRDEFLKYIEAAHRRNPELLRRALIEDAETTWPSPAPIINPLTGDEDVLSVREPTTLLSEIRAHGFMEKARAGGAEAGSGIIGSDEALEALRREAAALVGISELPVDRSTDPLARSTLMRAADHALIGGAAGGGGRVDHPVSETTSPSRVGSPDITLSAPEGGSVGGSSPVSDRTVGSRDRSVSPVINDISGLSDDDQLRLALALSLEDLRSASDDEPHRGGAAGGGGAAERLRLEAMREVPPSSVTNATPLVASHEEDPSAHDLDHLSEEEQIAVATSASLVGVEVRPQVTNGIPSPVHGDVGAASPLPVLPNQVLRDRFSAVGTPSAPQNLESNTAMEVANPNVPDTFFSPVVNIANGIILYLLGLIEAISRIFR